MLLSILSTIENNQKAAMIFFETKDIRLIKGAINLKVYCTASSSEQQHDYWDYLAHEKIVDFFGLRWMQFSNFFIASSNFIIL